MSKTLIVYFSRKGENYWNGSIRNLSRGNTEIVAEMIADLTGGDLFQVETVKTYAEDYYACIDEAKKELQEGARPELKQYSDNLDSYENIVIGFPNWWGTMPMAMFTFLEHYDLTGKKIIPFCTNEGSGMGQSEEDIRKICPGAYVGSGLSIKGSTAADAGPDIKEWLQEK